MTVIRIATRGSAQARAQAEAVGAAVTAASGAAVEYVLVETQGDVNQSTPLHQMGGQGIFVKEVQRAVLDGRADVAVHSAKDLPSAQADGLVIGAFTQRRSPEDVLVGLPLAQLAQGATVATGSVRRRAQLALVRPDLRFEELRGNIQTRLSRVPDGGSIVMARAALEILELTGLIAETLDVDTAVPMVGQGCVAAEARTGDERVLVALAAVDHAPTRRAVETERAFLAELGAGCSLPVAAHMSPDGVFRAFMSDGTDSVQVTGHVGGTDDHRIVGTATAVECRRLLAGGAAGA
jgi:hydroxymethylbilane synthase